MKPEEHPLLANQTPEERAKFENVLNNPKIQALESLFKKIDEGVATEAEKAKYEEIIRPGFEELEQNKRDGVVYEFGRKAPD